MHRWWIPVVIGVIATASPGVSAFGRLDLGMTSKGFMVGLPHLTSFDLELVGYFHPYIPALKSGDVTRVFTSGVYTLELRIPISTTDLFDPGHRFA